MPARAARRDDDVVEALELFPAEIQAAELREAIVVDGAAAHRVLDGLRLLHDLLQHEVIETAFLDLVQIPIDARRALLHRFRIQIHDVITVLGQHRHLTVIEVHDLARMLENGSHVAGDVVLAFAETDEQRAALPGGDDLFRIARTITKPSNPCITEILLT